MLVGIPMILVGTLPLVFAFGWWHTFFDSASWKEVPGTVLSATLEKRRSSKGNISYRLKGKYRYAYAGETFIRERLFIEGETSGSQSSVEKNLRFLETNRKDGTPVPVLVNPKSPGESIIFRSVSLLMGILKPKRQLPGSISLRSSNCRCIT